MNYLKWLPNFLTCCNLLCGILAIAFTSLDSDYFSTSTYNTNLCPYLIFAAAFFDFLDGMVARLVNHTSPIGKDLDSLADLVSFGVAPALIWFHLNNPFDNIWQFIYLILPVFSALRLAKFNNDSRQSDSFLGLPTPSAGMFMASAVLISNTDFSFYLINPIICILLCILMISNIPLFSLKLKNLDIIPNFHVYFLLILSAISIIILKGGGIAIAIILYIMISFIKNLKIKTQNK